MSVMVVVDNVSVKRRGRLLLDGVSAEVRNGEVLGLSGPNGSGKTMLMRVIAGLIRPASGAAFIGGAKVAVGGSMPESIGLMLETPSFLEGYSGIRNLELLASIRAQIGADRLREVLREVGLDPDDSRPVRKYSLGMRQRLGIAIAVMECPRVVLLDEPGNALDANGMEMLRGLVAEQKRRGAAVVLASHDRAFLEEMSDRIVFLSEGRIVGTAEGE